MNLSRRSIVAALAASVASCIVPPPAPAPTPSPTATPALVPVARVAPEEAPDWAIASAEQRGLYGFVSDEAGLVDPSDPLTLNLSLVSAD